MDNERQRMVDKTARELERGQWITGGHVVEFAVLQLAARWLMQRGDDETT
jgi:hypothetical protein